MSNAITKLYEATDAARALESMLQETEGDITGAEEAFDALAAKADSLPAAVDDVLSLVAEIEHRAAARKAEAERLRQRMKRDEAIADWMRGQVLRLLQERGTKVMETPRFRATVATPGGKPALEMVDEVPAEFTREVITREIDKEKIRAALDGGTVLAFARLVPKQPYLKVS